MMVVLLALLAVEPAPVPEPDVRGPPAAVGAAPEQSALTGPGAAESVPPLVPPTLTRAAQIPIPEGVRLEQPVTVRVLIRIDTEGRVQWVRLVSGGGPPFDEAVLTAATHFTFEPATVAGEKVAVDIEFSQTFAPPEPVPEQIERPPTAVLRGQVMERGTRRRVAMAQVVAEIDGEPYDALTAEDGMFRLVVPPGEAKVEVVSASHLRFRVVEHLAAGESLTVRYLVERKSYDPYETVVIGRRERQVVARTTLRERELKQVPGTFGDPFRVIETLPGVANVMSLLAYPIVRGSSPGNTGFLLDGVRVPQLFHLLAGPAVVHPELIDRVDFYPGTFPVEYGGYIGGIVDGITRAPRREERTLDTSVDLTKAGLFVRGPSPGGGLTATVAGRYGYPGLLLSVLNTDARLSYWDYQARLDGSAGRGRWKAFAFGSFDEMGEKEADGTTTILARTQFHRFDVSYHMGRGEYADTYKLVFGIDQTLADEGGGNLRALFVEPRARWKTSLTDTLSLQFGVDGAVRRFRGTTSTTDEDVEEVEDVLSSDLLLMGAHLATPYRPSDDLIVVPGFRMDTYDNGVASQGAIDPRLLARYRVRAVPSDREGDGYQGVGDVWLKGGAGLYHQPPRFFIPIPGFEELALGEGLLASTQVSGGVEASLFDSADLDAQVYYQYMDPILFDLALSFGEEAPAGRSPRSTGQTAGDGGDDDVDFFDARVGRSYGFELLLKHRGRGRLFGWLSYTLAYSERRDGGRWVPFEFDRRHMLNVVAGVSLPRNWDVGLRGQLQSGVPLFDDRGAERGRAPAFYRLDLRIDKRAVYNEWLLDFYVDVINFTLSKEQLGESPDSGLRYVLPTVGLRAVL